MTDHKTVREALDEAYEFIECDKKHSNSEIRVYAGRVCKQIEQALAALDRIKPVETVTVEEYAERMRGAVVLDGQYSYCYGRDTAKVFPHGLRIVPDRASAPADPSQFNLPYEG